MSNCFICQFDSDHSQVCPKHEETEWSFKFTEKPKMAKGKKSQHKCEVDEVDQMRAVVPKRLKT